MSIFQNSSECAVLPPETKVCGPGGLHCILGSAGVSAVCECEEGWTNFGDFAMSPGGPCDMNILAVRALWAIMGISNFFSFLFAAWFLWGKLKGSKSFGRLKENFDGASLTVYYFSFSGLSFTITGIIRATNPLVFIVGGDLFTSFIYSFGLAAFWLGALTYFQNIVTVAYKNLRMKSDETKAQSTKTLESIHKTLPGFKILSVLLCFLPFVMAIVNNSFKGTEFVGKYDQTIAGIHYFGIAALELILGIFLVPRWINALIEDCEMVLDLKVNVAPGSANVAMSDNRTERLRATVKKFKFIKGELCKQGTINGILSIFFGSWEYLTHKSSYILPFNITCIAIVVALVTWTLSNFSSRVQKDTGEDITTLKSSGTKNKTRVIDLISTPKATEEVTVQEGSYAELRREPSVMADDNS